MHLGIGDIDNWPPLKEGLVVRSEGEIAAALTRVREGSTQRSCLDQFTDKKGDLTFTGAAKFSDLQEVTGLQAANTVHVNSRWAYEVNNAKVGTGLNAPPDSACDRKLINAAIGKVLNDLQLLLVFVTSSIARTVTC